MRIHDEVRSPAGLRKRHIFLPNNKPTNPLLPMSTRKLIPQLRPPHLPEDSLDQQIMVVIRSSNNPIDIERHMSLQNPRPINKLNIILRKGQILELILDLRGHNRGLLIDKNIAIVDKMPHLGETILIAAPILLLHKLLVLFLYLFELHPFGDHYRFE